MDALITAIITLVGSVLAITVTEIVGWKKVLNRMGECKLRPLSERFNNIANDIGVDKNVPCLTQQHRNLETILYNEIVASVNNASINTKETYTLIKNEKKVRQQRETLLSANEYRLSQAIDELSSFKNIWQEQKECLQKFSGRISELENENRELKQTIDKQNKIIREYERQSNNRGFGEKTHF